jgi:hypothetical protein
MAMVHTCNVWCEGDVHALVLLTTLTTPERVVAAYRGLFPSLSFQRCFPATEADMYAAWQASNATWLTPVGTAIPRPSWEEVCQDMHAYVLVVGGLPAECFVARSPHASACPSD